MFEDWRHSARCKTENPEMFFDSAKVEQAKAVCVPCPVRAECLAWARKHGKGDEDGTGVWGGMDPAERRAERRQATRERQRMIDAERKVA